MAEFHTSIFTIIFTRLCNLNQGLYKLQEVYMNNPLGFETKWNIKQDKLILHMYISCNICISL